MNDDTYGSFAELVRNANPTLGAICSALRAVISELHNEHAERIEALA